MRVRILAAAAACRSCLTDASATTVGDEPAADDDGIESAWLYGNMNRYAYYFADLLIGSPQQQRASVIVDTGSHLAGFPCKGCDHCGEHLDPAFDLSRSESARRLRCGADCTIGCEEGNCSYSETYSEGSTISGIWFEDAVQLGDAFSKNPPVRARLGCHTNENKLFYTQRANGIMGLAPAYQGFGSNGSCPTFLQDLFRDKKHVDSRIFSICLAAWGGRLTVGGYDSSYHVHNALPGRICSQRSPCAHDGTQWIRMHAEQYYFVFPQGMMVDDRPLEIHPSDFGTTIVDSGTTYSYFPRGVYQALTAQLKAYCASHSGCAAEATGLPTKAPGGPSCWRLQSPGDGPQHFPLLRIVFDGNVAVDWPWSGYLYQRGEPGLWCQSFMLNNLRQTVLGISWMLHKDVVFDISRSRVGVATAQCPEHRREPALLNKQQDFSRLKLQPEEVSLGSGGFSLSLLDGRCRALAYAVALSVCVATLALWAALFRRKRRPGRSSQLQMLQADEQPATD